MKRLVICAFALLSMGSNAQSGMMEHGGLGFLYTDFNNFSNPAHLGLDKGSAVQGAYSYAQGGVQDANASFASGNGKVGFGAFGDSSGTNVTNFSTSTQNAGGELGFALGKATSLGVSYQKLISTGSTNSGVVAASLDIFGMKGTESGVGLSLGASTMLNDSVKNLQTATAALGYAFKANSSIEADVTFNDWSNWNDYSLSTALTLGSQMVYFSSLYKYSALSSVSALAGRVGLNLGKNFDISGTIGYTLNGATSPTYGGTLRVSF